MRNCYQSKGCGPMPCMMQPDGCENASACTCYLAISTVPWQQFTNAYEPAQALKTGTVFPELDKPFLGRSVMRT